MWTAPVTSDDDRKCENGRDERHGPAEQGQRDRREQSDPRANKAERTGADRIPVDGSNRKPGQEPGRRPNLARGRSATGWAQYLLRAEP